MLKEKRKDLESERQKKLLQGLVEQLSRSEADLYYRSTSDIASRLKTYIDGEAELSTDDRDLLKQLSKRDIEVLLSLH
ncbi:MAG: hypothetical protein AAGF58_17145 [Pseudomonadota bacterium]